MASCEEAGPKKPPGQTSTALRRITHMLPGTPTELSLLRMLSSKVRSFELQQNRTAALPCQAPMPQALGTSHCSCLLARTSPSHDTHLDHVCPFLPSPAPPHALRAIPEPQALPAGSLHWTLGQCRNETGQEAMELEHVQEQGSSLGLSRAEAWAGGHRAPANFPQEGVWEFPKILWQCIRPKKGEERLQDSLALWAADTSA